MLNNQGQSVLLFWLVAGVLAVTPAHAGYTIHVVEPAVTNHMIMHDGPLPPVCKQATVIELFACRGEYEPASFVITAKKPLPNVRIEVGRMTGPGRQWPKEAVDIRVVKDAYRLTLSGYLPTDVPTLLVHDEKFLFIEAIPNDPWNWKRNVARGPLRDTVELQPVHIYGHKQFWITVHVPEDAEAGTYNTTLRIVPENGAASKLTLRVEVYPFELLPPMKDYSIYYPVRLVPEGSPDWRSGKWTNTAWITPSQYLAECKNMVAHGLTNPGIAAGPRLRPNGSQDFSQLEKILDLRERAGMVPGGPIFIFSGGGMIMRSGDLTAEEKRSSTEATRKVMAWARARGYSEVYFMGGDEASGERLRGERDSFEAIHEGGGKIAVACNTDFFDIIGDLLDRPILVAPIRHQLTKFAGENYAAAESLYHMPEIAKAGSFERLTRKDYREIIDAVHKLDRKIYVYMNPMAGQLLPELQRRNEGLGLWRVGFDGTKTWAYTHHDADTNGKNQRLNFAKIFRTEGGVLDTLHWEGYREGVDDIRYLTTLMAILSDCADRFGKNDLVVQTYAWLDEVDIAEGDLDDIRREMARRIIALLELGAP